MSTTGNHFIRTRVRTILSVGVSRFNSYFSCAGSSNCAQAARQIFLHSTFAASASVTVRPSRSASAVCSAHTRE